MLLFEIFIIWLPSWILLWRSVEKARMDLSIVLKTIVWWCVTCFESEMVVVCYRRKLIAKSLPDMVTIDKLPYTNYDYSYVSTLQGVIQSNPVFIVKTQLTERSRITEKHRENHIKKTSRTLKTRKKVMRMPVMKSVGVFVQQSIIKLLAARCPFFSGRVMLWRRFRRLCWESDLGGKFFKDVVCTVPNFWKQSFISIKPERAARRRNVSKRRRSADVEKPHHAGAA